MKEYLLGIDIGTTLCKCLVFTPEGIPVVESHRGYPVYRPKPHWVEQDALDWWNATKTCVKQVISMLDKEVKIVAVGISGQQPTHVFVDKSGYPIRKAVIWQDTRAIEETDYLKKILSMNDMEKYLGIRIPLVPNLPPPRMIWFSRYEKETINSTYKLLQAKDFINLRLTGVYATDRTSNIGLSNIQNKCYCDEYLDILGIPKRILPDIYESFEIIGKVTSQASEETGLPSGIPVVAGWIDAWCNMLGTGLGKPGMAFDVAGTSEITGLTCLSPQSNNHEGLIAIPLYGDITVIYGLTNAGGDSFKWFKDNICNYPFVGKECNISYGEMEGEISKIKAGSEGLLFLPYLNGERSPIWDPKAKGAFVGLNRCHTCVHLSRAVMEGVGFSIRQILSRAQNVGNIKLSSVRLSGGGARSQVWNKIKADILGIPASVVSTAETGTLGAAMLAAIGIGFMKDYAEAEKNMVHIKETIQPDVDSHEIYNKLFELYEKLYPALLEINHDLWF